MGVKEDPDAKRERVRTWLMSCSGQELADFLMARHSAAAVARRQMRDLMDKWVEETADARLAAEVHVIREELKHKSVLSFPEKVEESAPHPETPPANPAFEQGDHRGADLDAVRAQYPRQAFKR